MQLIEDDVDLSKYMAGPEANKIKPASDWEQALIDHFYGPKENRFQPKMPWKKTQNIFEFRPGEVTICAGINGHGKSLLWSEVVLGLLDQGVKVCVASLEMKPFRQMVRSARQAFASDQPAVSSLKQFAKWCKDKLWLYDKVGVCKPAIMLALIRYAVDNFGIHHFVIDNLTKVIPGEDDYNGQKDFINEVCALAADLNIHITVVMHVRKGEDENTPPNKMSIKGAGSITDMVDNILIVFRNKRKEREMADNNAARFEEADVLLLLEKQRNAEGDIDEAKFKLWFSRPGQNYLEDRTAEPMILSAFTRHMDL